MNCCSNRCKNAHIISSSVPSGGDAIGRPSKANFLGGFKGYHGLHPFRVWIQKVLPQVYDDSLSYQELIYKVMWYINTLIDDVNTMAENLELLKQAYQELEDFVNCYFDNLDLSGELERLLNEAVLDGSLFSAFNEYISLGSGLQSTVTSEIRTTTEEVVESVDDYPNCCSCCSCCEGCSYANLSDGDSVVSVYTGSNIKVTTTITRDGDEITTTTVTEETIYKTNIFTDLAEGDGISIDPASSTTSGTQTISALVKSGEGIGVEVDSDNYYEISNKIKGGAGISIELDENNYYKISSVEYTTLSDTLVSGSDFVYSMCNGFYPISGYGSYTDYEHLASGTSVSSLDGYGDMVVTGNLVKNSDGDITSCVVKIAPPRYLMFMGNMTSDFTFKHGSDISSVTKSWIYDFYFTGDYACLSNTSYDVSISDPDSHVWNVGAVGGNPSTALTSDSDSVTVFGASWNVTCECQTYTSGGVRHFVLAGTSIGDGYNEQYSRWGSYVYGYWLNLNELTISLN